jgi:hypothetical protein
MLCLHMSIGSATLGAGGIYPPLYESGGDSGDKKIEQNLINWQVSGIVNTTLRIKNTSYVM